MTDKVFNGRIIHKNDIEENWEKAINFIPKKSELIIYNPDNTHTQARVKVGDGVTKVNDLPFIIDDVKPVTTVNGKTGASIVLTGKDIEIPSLENLPIEDCILLTLNIANNAQDTANAAQDAADNAMPRSGGAFEGAVWAMDGPRDGGQIRNIHTYDSSWKRVATDRIITLRK